MSYTMIDNGRAIRCDQCGSASYNSNDIKHKYCGRCHKYHTSHSVNSSSSRYVNNEPDVTETWRMANGSTVHFVPAPATESLSPIAGSCDARPSSSDIDYGVSSSSCDSSSSSSDSGSSSSDCGGGWGGD
jgi:hypothetical protein